MAFSIEIIEFIGVQNLLHTDLISLATAAGGTESSAPGFMEFIPLMVIIWAVMYFMVIRPQKKQTSEHENMIASLEKHKEVRTVGGIIGKVALVDKDQVAFARIFLLKLSERRASDALIRHLGRWNRGEHEAQRHTRWRDKSECLPDPFPPADTA